MNDKRFQTENTSHDELSGTLKQAVAEVRCSQPPADSLNRVVDQAIQIANRPAVLLNRKRGFRLRALWSVATAAAILIAATAWLLMSRDTWAQVVKAVQMKPWIHATVTSPEGKKMESWMSLPREIYGNQCSDGQALFDDGKAKIRYEYHLAQGDEKENSLYREPLSPTIVKMSKQFDAFFTGAMQDAKSLDAPLPDAETVSQERRTVVEGDKTWTDYDFVLRNVSRDEKIRLVFRVDPKTNLPASMKISSLSGGPTPTAEFVFDYPAEDAGPRDIYDLGVPRTAKLIDRMPSENVEHIISKVQEAQKKFGSYFAIVAHTQDNAPPWQATEIDLVWRKGKKIRTEQAYIRSEKPPEKPADNVDMPSYFKNRLKDPKVWLIPSRLCDGDYIWTADFGKDATITEKSQPTWKKFSSTRNNDDFNTWVGVAQESMPDVMAYGFLPIPDQLRSVSLLKDAGGPAGCLVAEIKVSNRLPNTWARNLYWYDPQHTCMIRKSEMLDPQVDKKEFAYNDSYEVEAMAQTPSGLWYPTCIRRKVTYVDAAKRADNSTEVTWYFVDFNAKLPDSIFKPEPRTGDLE